MHAQFSCCFNVCGHWALEGKQSALELRFLPLYTFKDPSLQTPFRPQGA